MLVMLQMDAAMAVETLKSLKREDGKGMRSDFEDAWLGELDKKRAHAAKGRERVLEAKAAKEVKVHERMIWKRDKAAETSPARPPEPNVSGSLASGPVLTSFRASSVLLNRDPRYRID